MDEEKQAQDAANPPLRPDLAGYPNVDALVAGYRASSAEVQRIRQQHEAERQQWEAQVNAANQRQAPPQRDVFGQIEQYTALPAEIFRQAVREETAKQVQEAFVPLARGVQARNNVLAQYPDYGKFEADVAQFIEADPNLSQTYREVYQSNPQAAFEYAFLKFGESRRRSHGGSDNSVVQEQQAQAAIPGTRSGDQRNPGVKEQGALTDAWDHYKRTGDPKPFAKARLRGVIRDEFLNE